VPRDAVAPSTRPHFEAIKGCTLEADDEPGKAKRRRRARDSRASGVKSLCELAREP
jgi:hypothetical protein